MIKDNLKTLFQIINLSRIVKKHKTLQTLLLISEINKVGIRGVFIELLKFKNKNKVVFLFKYHLLIIFITFVV